MTRLKVISPGVFSQIQDRGRYGYAHYGVPASGPMDPVASRLANAVVGNDPNAAVVELTASGGQYLIMDGGCTLCIGGDVPASANGAMLAPWVSHRLKTGSELRLGIMRQGMRAYLAFAGGIDVEPVLGSRATLTRAGLGGWHGRALQKGDELPLLPSPYPRGRRYCSHHLLERLYPQGPLAVIAGPQQDAFPPSAFYDFTHSRYRISAQADRMGYRLAGAPLSHLRGADMVSDAVVPGSIQVPGNGQPIVALHDRQTTGGYPKIATIISADLPRLGQMRPGQGLSFMAVDLNEAMRRGARLRHGLDLCLQHIDSTEIPWS